MPYQLPPYPQLVAHRGNSSPSPENTRLAIEQAISLGVDMVEVDVRLSRDDLPVLIHNQTLRQTTNGSGRVAKHTLAELKLLDAGSWKDPQFAGEPLLTLHESLELARHRVGLNLDLKTHSVIWSTLEAVRQMNMTDEVIVTGCCWKCVKTVRRSEARLTVLLNLNQAMDFLARRRAKSLFQSIYLSQARTANVAGININHHYVDQELVDAAKRSGLSIWTWTVDDENRFRKLLAIGVDSITTNWPERMIPMIQQHRNHHFGEQS